MENWDFDKRLVRKGLKRKRERKKRVVLGVLLLAIGLILLVFDFVLWKLDNNSSLHIDRYYPWCFFGLIILGVIFFLFGAGFLALGIFSGKKAVKELERVKKNFFSQAEKAGKKKEAEELYRKALNTDGKEFIRAVEDYQRKYGTPKKEIETLRNASGRRIATHDIEMHGEGGFDGKSWQKKLYGALGIFVSIISLGLLYPLSAVFNRKWVTDHSVYEGRRLHFDGGLGSFYFLWLKGFLLSIVTLGIYGFFLAENIMVWEAKHTHMSGEDERKGSDWDGNSVIFFLYKVIYFFGMIFSLTLLKPFLDVWNYRYKFKHTVYDGRRLRFDGSASGLFVRRTKTLVLNIITLGIYGFFNKFSDYDWICKRVKLEEAR